MQITIFQIYEKKHLKSRIDRKAEFPEELLYKKKFRMMRKMLNDARIHHSFSLRL